MLKNAKNIEYNYCKVMESLKSLNREIKAFENCNAYKISKISQIVLNYCKKGQYYKILKYFNDLIRLKTLPKRFHTPPLKNNDNVKSNYFSDEKIAVYTCVIGGYDNVAEPILCPDNCDFYLISDQQPKKESRWKWIDAKNYINSLSGYSNADINRYFKMHPDVVFNNYKYSIYLDGNIQPITDLTEFVNKIPPCGIAAHRHSFRNCVYEEAEVLILLKKDKIERLKNHIEFLRDSGMPEQYGLVECNVIAREHNNPTCKAVMKSWWQEYLSESKRDQLSFVHALFLNGITVNEVTTLGNNVFDNDAIRKRGHE